MRIATDPLRELAAWRKEASGTEPDPDAMVLATAAPDTLSARVVLCRGIDDRGLLFYTNYESHKGQQLAKDPRAAAVFLWPTLHRQVRVEGRVEQLTPGESDAYFASRPRGHQLSAWASHQSARIQSLDEVHARQAELERTYAGREVPRPPHWGGYRLVAERVELWEQGENRLHRRRLYHREGRGWREELLSP